MSTALISLDQFAAQGGLPTVFGPVSDSDFDAMTSGVSLGYGVISFRGKVWRVRHANEEKVLRDAKGQPLRVLRCVLIGSNSALSKTFYEGAYEPGSNNPPDCASIDGIKPDMGVANPQSMACATCHNNQFGSKVTDAGKKLKACTDSRRLALVPYPDVVNEEYGGPMMLRVPPASLVSLANAVGVLRTGMIPPHAAVIDIGFEIDAEYPMLTFTPRAVISDPALAAVIMDYRNGELTRQILHGAQAAVMNDALSLPAARPIAALAQTPAPVAEAPKRTRAKATPAATPAPAAAAPVADDDGLDDLGLTVAATPAPKASGRRVEAQVVEPAAAAADPLDADDDDVLGDILAGLD